jgi:hypothetical protein
MVVIPLLALLIVGASGSLTPRSTASAPKAVRGVVHDPVVIETTSHGMVTSTNWSGYAVTGATFTTVVGTWVQPTVTCSNNQQEDSAFWAGIDGFGKRAKTVEQVGTDSDCDKGKGKTGIPTYYAWWEMFPLLSNNLSTSMFPVSHGDTMTATVTSSGSGVNLMFTMSLNDVSKGWSFSTPAQQSTLKAPQASAEWIAEAPSICTGSKCKLSKLANFGIVNFSSASANGDPISTPSFNENQINMTKGKTKKATTSALGGGTAFSVTWDHS